MSKEIIIETKTVRELALEAVNSKLAALNTVNDAETVDFSKLAAAQTEFNLALVELNAAEKAEDFTKLLAGTTPALAAIKQGACTFTSLKVPSEKEPHYSLKTKLEIIDLQELKEFADTNLEKPVAIFADQRALMFAEALNHLVLAYAAGGMGVKKFGKKLDTFRLKNTADLLKVDGKEVKTVKGICTALQTVADKITAGLKITTDDAVALLMNYSKWGKEINGVSMPIEANFRRMLTRVLYKVANGVDYDAE